MVIKLTKKQTWEKNLTASQNQIMMKSKCAKADKNQSKQQYQKLT